MATISAEAAWETICGVLRPLPSAAVDLGASFGAYLAEPVRADRDIPPADRSAMDGFAVRAADIESVPSRLRVVGEMAAGSPVGLAIGPGECARIYTGGNIPSGADAIVRVEDTAQRAFAGQAHAPEAVIEVAIAPGVNIFRAAENARMGEELLPAGTRLGPTQAAVAAACGHSRPIVHERPRVAILATGTELLDEGAAAPEAHQIRDSNTPMILAACQGEGAAVVARVSVPDDLETTQRAVRDAASRADVIVLTGGVSMGDRDYVRPALEALGATVHYHGIAMRPGRPQLFAVLPEGVAVFGLPGNPLSAAVGLHEYVLPALRLLSGCPAALCRPVLWLPLESATGKQGPWLQVIPAVVRTGPGGSVVCPRPPVGSADLVTAGRAEGAILLPPDSERAEAGHIVAFRPWGSSALV